MVAANSAGKDPVISRLALRLSENRRLIAAAAVVLFVLFLAGTITATGGILAFIAFAALVVAIPAARPRNPVPAPAAGTPPVESEAGVKLFAEALPVPCFILDRRGVVRYANERAAAMFPIRIGEALTFHLRVPDLVAAFDSVAKGGPPVRVEFGERVPTERWFAAWFTRLDSRQTGGDDRIVLIVDDLSERRNADRVRVDFVANASHELRTPLASLAGFIETLQGPARDDPAARERFLAIMQEQAERMSRLVDDLLSLSRIEMKAHVRPSDPVDLVAVVRHVVDSLAPLAADLGVTIETDLPEAPVIVRGDRDELFQVFENLIDNAAKYGQAGKRVIVAVVAGAGGPRVTVRDFGPGIPEEHIPRLTERFYRVDLDASRRHRGTGLGLAIVKHILARHQARMTIDSRLGEGAAFSVSFPPMQPMPIPAGVERSKDTQ
ncbi:MAG: ATP-binding protein [Bauldia sp.]|nr:ATP-binding protein [Bauldia sp.]